uniref:Uncharacterized protein n=1 Tax=Rhizophora mucronata TaxID=61149 RepID=A0A2P2NXL7_RHIMU
MKIFYLSHVEFILFLANVGGAHRFRAPS